MTAVLAALACTLIALVALPGLASAAEYSEFPVNSLLDTVETTACETSSTSDECTLRSAIDLANATANVGTSIDRITFSSAVFGGAAPASRISIGSPLPAITEAVEIFGGETAGRQCPTGWGLEGPCVEVLATGGTEILPVDASDVTVEGIAFDGAENGIMVNEGQANFTATNDWFGVGLNRGLGSGLSKSGIRLEPGADGATIGGPDASETRRLHHRCLRPLRRRGLDEHDPGELLRPAAGRHVPPRPHARRRDQDRRRHPRRRNRSGRQRSRRRRCSVRKPGAPNATARATPSASKKKVPTSTWPGSIWNT